MMPTGYVPSYVQESEIVLRFIGFFLEDVPESSIETVRSRQVAIEHYPVDGTFRIIEAHKENSGIPQGVFLSRQKISKANGEFLKLSDLQIGGEVNMCGQLFFITAISDGTRKYMKDELNIDMPENLPEMEDKYLELRREQNKPRRPVVVKKDTLNKFLSFDGKVLRFYAYWNNLDEMFGQISQYVIHYYLSDDTVEVYKLENGRSEPFLRRQPLPLGDVPQRSVIEKMTQHPVEAVYSAETEYVRPHHFKLGQYLDVFGRPFMVYSCDKTTERYMQSIGHELDVESGKRAYDIVANNQSAPTKRIIPPHQGIGTEEDSLQNVNHLIPKPPKRDFVKFLKMDGKILRFKAKIQNAKGFNKDREFIISFFLSDDTILVFEPPKRNSGITSGKFLERSKIVKERPTNQPLPIYYGVEDLRIGNVLNLNGFMFELLECDPFTEKFLANIHGTTESVVNKPLSETLQRLELNQQYQEEEELIHESVLRDMLREQNFSVNDDEWMQLLSIWEVNENGMISMSKVTQE
eukprot:TRINITY_DN3031_c0_g1_i1.p1 TRINITY_DN3031_c0_g1~~TRINITY_DN3031_c0_g1_i1.p1  ORF type:complete len:522 (+),score=173.25 TRINITY_DN3031_c0_g1_i1:274-1839(+)